MFHPDKSPVPMENRTSRHEILSSFLFFGIKPRLRMLLGGLVLPAFLFTSFFHPFAFFIYFVLCFSRRPECVCAHTK